MFCLLRFFGKWKTLFEENMIPHVPSIWEIFTYTYLNEMKMCCTHDRSRSCSKEDKILETLYISVPKRRLC